MKLITIGIMALLLIGSAFAMALPKEEHMECTDCGEPVVVEPVEVQDDGLSNNDDREYCNFDIERPYCLIDIWKKNKEIIVNDNEVTIDYNYRKNKDTFSIDGKTYQMEKHGAFYIGEFDVGDRTFELWKNRRGLKLRILET